MIIVKQGKLVVNHRIFTAGDEIDILDSDAEARIVAAGLAEFAEDRTCEPDAPDELAAKTKAELQAICRDYGLSDKGNKNDLMVRIAGFESGFEDDEPEGEDLPQLTAEVPR